MKKILLIDVDSKIPNIALMKLSTYYKKLGYEVDLRRLGFDGYPHKRNNVMVFADEYEKVFVSIIFTQNKNVVQVYNCDNVEFGGSGVDLIKKLPQEVDDCKEDYSIYPDNNISYGFITRGCIRNCYFCFVPKKEGFIHKYRDPKQIIRHKKVHFLDNNILGFKGHEELLKELIDIGIRCQFNQGLDIRLLNDERAELLSKLNYDGEYIFAFDHLKDLDFIEEKTNLFKKYVPKDWKMKMFVFVSPEMDIHNDIMFRVEWCRNNKILPYIMRHEDCWSSDYNEFFIDLSAYCNQPAQFKMRSFENFLDERHKTELRKEKTLKILVREKGAKDE